MNLWDLTFYSLLTLTTLATLLIYFIVCYGCLTTSRLGFPSISTLISDNDVLRILFIVAVILYHVSISLMLVSYHETVHNTLHQRPWIIFAITLGIFKVIFFVLVAILDIYYLPVEHYAITVCAFGAALTRHAIFAAVRQPPIHKPWIRVIEWMIWALTLIMIFTYGMVVMLSPDPNIELTSGISFMEYIGVILLLILNYFHMWDLHKHVKSGKCTCSKVMREDTSSSSDDDEQCSLTNRRKV